MGDLLNFPTPHEDPLDAYLCRHCGGQWWNAPVTFNQQLRVDGWSTSEATCHQCGEPMS